MHTKWTRWLFMRYGSLEEVNSRRVDLLRTSFDDGEWGLCVVVACAWALVYW
jgi:hypothetical protein